MNAILQRIKSPATWASLSVLGVVVGLPPGTIDAAGQIVAGCAALAGIVMSRGEEE